MQCSGGPFLDYICSLYIERFLHGVAQVLRRRAEQLYCHQSTTQPERLTMMMEQCYDLEIKQAKVY